MLPFKEHGMKRFAVYARKSKRAAREGELSASIELQRDHCRQRVEELGGVVVLEEHDDGISGALFAGRPGLQRVIAAATSRQIDAVIFYSLDRFGRNPHRSEETLKKLYNAGAEVRDTEKPTPYDPYTIESWVTWGIGGHLAAEHAKQTRRKTRDGMRRDARDGKWLLPPPFGYDKPKTSARVDGTPVGYDLVIRESEAEVIRRIAALFVAGVGLHAICRKLAADGVTRRKGKRWATNNLRALLRSDTIRGRLVYGKSKVYWDGDEELKGTNKERQQLAATLEERIVVDKPHWRILDAATIELIDARLAERKLVAKKPEAKTHGRYLLSGGLLVCPDCGANFEARTQWKKYACSTRRRAPGSCPNRDAWLITEADAAVISLVEMHAPEFKAEFIAHLAAQRPVDARAHLEVQLAAVEKKLGRLVDAVADGALPVAQAKRKTVELEAERTKLLAELARCDAAIDLEVEEQLADEATNELLVALRSADPALARAALRRVLKEKSLVLQPSPRPGFLSPQAVMSNVYLLGKSPTRFDHLIQERQVAIAS